jgi:hypothetical protein
MKCLQAEKLLKSPADAFATEPPFCVCVCVCVRHTVRVCVCVCAFKMKIEGERLSLFHPIY